jgi:Zn-dependent metalloprotease
MRTERFLAAVLLAAALLISPASALPPSAVPLGAVQLQRQARAESHLLAARPALGLGPRDGFVTRHAFTTGQGKTVLHLDQTWDGHRVWGGRAIAHVRPDGSVQALTGGLQQDVQVTGQPALSPGQAVALALRHLAPRGAMPDQPRVSRVVFPAQFTGGLAWTMNQVTGRPVLDRKLVVHARPAAPFVWAYEVRTRLANRIDGMKELVYVIDGNTGNILRVNDALQRVGPGATPMVGTGTGYYRGPVTLQTSQLLDGTYALYDPGRGSLPNPNLESITGITGIDAATGWSATGLQVWYEEHTPDAISTLNTFLFQSNPVNSWGDGLPFTAWSHENQINGQTAGVDALSAMSQVWDFYRAVFGWDGMDGQGTSAFAQVLMTGTYDLDNAWWSTWANGAYLGAGSWPANPGGLQSVTDLDVIAHEMTHGVTGATANFVNAAGYEEAGLCEATSDFFSHMALAWIGRGPGDPVNQVPEVPVEWQIGKNVGHGTPIRWLDRPSRDRRSANGWYHGLEFMDGHFSAGVLNRALFFLARGASSTPGDDGWSPYLPGGMTGIGNDAAARIWFKTLTERLHADGAGNVLFADARREAVAAAQELFPADPSRALAVELAFTAVNVGDAPGAPPRTEVVFADWRNGDYIMQTHATQYANREIFPKHETVRMRVTVKNNPDTSVAWSLGGPSLYNGADSWVAKGGVINADGSWTTPNQMGWHAVTATSTADPGQFAEGRAFLIDMDSDMDGEQDALDMGGIAFSWYLTNAINPAHSVFEAPWVDDGDVSFFVDAMASAWPTK